MSILDKLVNPIDPEALAQMSRVGGNWAAYRNEDMAHSECGRLVFLKFGAGCTFAEAPTQAPDHAHWGLGWRYRLAGRVNLAEGCIGPM